ncbi:lysozyme inhibitor LprI family protein [Noviherbaspirillum sp.]|jgi:uncharacterized protein YecT (DUF1311 family)|uniref:lysozyme inhibitor LprI family protein n=1 Tax=Noviherbaspirillum sp. TaxID=1926288 RepID=UPI0025E28F95|nr:lysozyme inhibitor LprI family protein [Noviherbaspirillum sp.]
MSHRASIVGVLLSATVGAVAGEPCAGPDGVAICAVEASASAERELGAVCKRILRKAASVADASGHYVNLAPGIAKAQARWIAYRKSTCELERKATLLGNPNRGGPGALAEAACVQRLTKQRARELASFEMEYLE